MQMDTNFDVACRRHGPLVEIAPVGELDLMSAADLCGAVRERIGSGTQLLVIDLAQVTFIDSSGIAALLNCKAEAEAAGASIEIRDVQPFQRRVFEISGLCQLLDV